MRPLLLPQIPSQDVAIRKSSKSATKAPGHLPSWQDKKIIHQSISSGRQFPPQYDFRLLTVDYFVHTLHTQDFHSDSPVSAPSAVTSRDTGSACSVGCAPRSQDSAPLNYVQTTPAHAHQQRTEWPWWEGGLASQEHSAGLSISHVPSWEEEEAHSASPT